MNFLAPLFALGALAVVGPIIFHLVRQTTREVTPFSTLMFLQPTPPRVSRRSRWENLWLLLLRCLGLALLALGFARPFLPAAADSKPSGVAEGRRLVILVDRSASMRREALWDEARRKADAILGQTTPADEVAVLAFDRTVHPVLSFDQWIALLPAERAGQAGQRLAAVSPGWAATQLDTALIRATELLDEPARDRPLREPEIVVISDLQEGSRLEGLQGYEWPHGLKVRFEPVIAAQLENASAQWLPAGNDAAPTAAAEALRLRVTNSLEAKHEQLRLRWTTAAANSSALDLNLAAGQSRIVRAPQAPAGATALALTGDDTIFDNTVVVLPPQVAKVPVIFVGQDADEDPRGSLYYLRRAFPKTASQSVEIFPHRAAEAIPAAQLQPAQLLVLGEEASDAALGSARQFARGGQIIVAPLTSPAAAQTVARLLEIPAFSATEAAVKDYALLARIDFQHPLFSAFADPRYSDFTKIHFWKYRRLAANTLPGSRVVASFDSGDPAIVQMPLGAGSVFILASSWRPVDSQLALSSKFVPLLQSLLEQSSKLSTLKPQYFIDDAVLLPASPTPFTVRKPDGSSASADGGSSFTETDQPGLYALEPGGLRFVVNLGPEESRTSPLAPDRLASLGIPMSPADTTAAAPAGPRNDQAEAATTESRQKIWRWLILVAFGVLILETLLARKLSRPPQPLTAAAT